MRAERFAEKPIMRSDMGEGLGDSIDGPPLVRVPKWLPDPLGVITSTSRTARATT